MIITGVLANTCPVGHDCPKIIDTDGPDVIVQGDAITDPTVLAQLALPAGETAVTVPRSLIYPTELTLGEMAEWIDARHTFHLLRIENRRAYGTPSDGSDFLRYLDGEAHPTQGDEWLANLRASTDSGKAWTKVHVLSGFPSDYERYAMEWGFTRTTDAGEQVRILDAQPGTLLDVPDFWIVDHEHVIRMAYDDDGRFTAATPLIGADAAAYRALARAMWSEGVPFGTWWDAHPVMHRHRHAA